MSNKTIMRLNIVLAVTFFPHNTSLNVFYFQVVFVCFFTYINTYNLTQYHVNNRIKGSSHKF